MRTLIGAVPDGWREAPLADLCEAQLGGPHIRRAIRDDMTSGIPVLRAADIVERRIDPRDVTRLPDDVACDWARYRLAMGDILCARTDISRIAVVTVEHRGWLYGNTLLRLRPGGSLRPRFLAAYLMLPAVRDWIERRVPATAMSTISARHVNKLPVVVPPLSAQEAITEVLDALDEKVRIHAEISRTTSELRETLAPLLMTGAVAGTPA